MKRLKSLIQKKKKNSPKIVNKSRRLFFHRFVGEVISLVDEVQGIPQIRLDDIKKLPDQMIRKIKPGFSYSSLYFIENNRLVFKNKKSNQNQTIYQFGNREVYILNCFNQNNTLEDIGHMVSIEYNISYDSAYESAKSLFIMMTRYLICQPAHAHEE